MTTKPINGKKNTINVQISDLSQLIKPIRGDMEKPDDPLIS